MIPLHAHTRDGSMGDSILSIEEYVLKGKSLGLTHLAITDHGSLGAIYHFNKECKKNGITPIIGCEVYLSFCKEAAEEDIYKNLSYHLVLIAYSNKGFDNLVYLTNQASTKHFYKKPIVLYDELALYHEGLICLTACMGGPLGKLILQEHETGARYHLYDLKVLFGDRLYLELQPGTHGQEIVNEQLVKYHQTFNIPLVITNDIHYLNYNDTKVHNMHCILYRGNKNNEYDPDTLIYKNDCYYLMTDQDLISRTHNVPFELFNEALDNTYKIANMCDVTLQSVPDMPTFINTSHPELTNIELFKKLLHDRLNTYIHIVDSPFAYTERLRYEISVIDQLGYVDYFLIVWDLINYAKLNKIAVGPGRGSCGGSLVSFLLGITIADPIKYDLCFERFLSPYRTGIPDIDIDFSSEDRVKMFDYVKSRYGEEHCCLITTFQMRKARTAIKDCASMLHIDPQEALAITKLIPEFHYGDEGEKENNVTLAMALECTPELEAYRGLYPKLFEYALELEQMPRNYGKHASGIIITPNNVLERLPLRHDSKQDRLYTTSLDLNSAENIALKFDFLGLSTLSVIDRTLEEVPPVDLNDESFFQDEKVWRLIGSSNTAGIFQLGSSIYKKRMPYIKPTNLLELGNCIALLRGPCLASGMDKTYIDVCLGKRKIEYLHPLYDQVLESTKGVLIYQEQIMFILQNFGFSSEDSFHIMKVTTKSKDAKKMLNHQEEFFNRAKQKGVESEIAERIWAYIKETAKYCFNKSHKICVALYSDIELKTS